MSVDVVIWDPTRSDAEEQFAAVLALHKANRATLGPMPDTAFRDRAKHSGLLLGCRDGATVAYLLYGIPRHNLVKLIHLCVDSNARGSGIAKSLVEQAISLHPSRSMLTATCRTDYGIDGFWQSLGLHAASERKGRALSGSILTNWVKRINLENGLDLLETASLESGLPLAALDTNIVGDLFSPGAVRRDHREESSELKADWLQPLVTFAVSGEVNNEINKIADPAYKKHLRESTTHLTRLSTRRPTDRTLEDELLDAVDAALLAKDPSLKADVLQLADAIHAGADYFVTNDSNIHLAAAGWKLDERGINVVRPHELIRALTPASFMSDFRSRLIDDSDLQWRVVTDADPALESLFRVYSDEPKPVVFNQRLRDVLAKPKSITVQQLHDGNGRPWALAAFEVDSGVLRLPLLRVFRGERGGTVAFQLIRYFRKVAWGFGATRIEITDPAISQTLDGALRADGFSDGGLRGADLGPATMSCDDLGVNTTAEVVSAERSRWPLVVTGAGLPTYLIPIQPKWASRLFGLDDGLFPARRRGLGLSRELVYFSGSRLVPRELPARVLWYASSDKTMQLSQIVARSVMVDATRVPVDEAIERFAKLGVFRKSDIKGSADKEGSVSVIRFQDTERLQRTVSRHDEIFKQRVKGQVQSMRSVDPQFFDEVLALQTDKVQAA